jgi:glutamate racemase
LREQFPGVPFVGIEPAIKPAALGSRVKAIGVLATAATFEGPLFARVVEQFAQDVRLIGRTCPGLVEIIEEGEIGGRRIRSYLEGVLHPLLEEGIDALVLGCTHYPFALEAIREIVGPGVAIVDPCPAGARQVKRVLEERVLAGAGEGAGEIRYYTSGSPAGLEKALKLLLCEEAPVGRVRWQGGGLEEA